MRFICLGYIEEGKFENMSENERKAMMEECFAYDDWLRKNGHFAGGDGLQGPRTAKTLRYQNGKVIATDGPFAETREQLGGYFLVDARDLDEALAIAERIPMAAKGTIEVRPVIEIPGLPPS